MLPDTVLNVATNLLSGSCYWT